MSTEWRRAARVRLYQYRGHWLAMAYEEDVEDATDRVLAIASGEDETEACRQLVHVVSRPEGPRLTTSEVAVVLGIDDSGVRRRRISGQLQAAVEGGPRVGSLFDPREVARRLAEREQSDG